MNERARNRAVGTVILVSLAAIFLPMLLDGEGFERREVPRMPAGDLPAAAPDQVIDPADEEWAFVEDARRQRDRDEPLDGRPVHLPPADEAAGQAVLDEAVEPEADPEADADTDGGREAALETAPAPDPGAELDAALGADGVPLAWSVQLATFASRDNADRLRERLLDDGYEAYLVPSRESGRTLYRVAVGPRLDRNAVLRLKAELAERYELDGLVVQFSLAGLQGED